MVCVFVRGRGRNTKDTAKIILKYNMKSLIAKNHVICIGYEFLTKWEMNSIYLNDFIGVCKIVMYY